MSIKKAIKNGIKFILTNIPTKKVYANITSLAQNKLLEGRTALITGGTSGIGYEIAKAFVNAGASVIITGRSQNRINDICDQLCTETATTNRIFGLEMDITKTHEIAEKFSKATSFTGKIDILVNNAGILGCQFSSGTPQQFDNVINTNLKGVFFLSQTVAHYMKEQKIKGNILNIASSSSVRPATSAYTLSKWGIKSLTLGMARMLIPHGIVVNGIAPGPTASPMLLSDGPTDNLALKQIPAKRYVLPNEIANMAVILVSDMSRMIIGDIIYMTGGAGNLSTDDIDYTFE